MDVVDGDDIADRLGKCDVRRSVVVNDEAAQLAARVASFKLRPAADAAFVAEGHLRLAGVGADEIDRADDQVIVRKVFDSDLAQHLGQMNYRAAGNQALPRGHRDGGAD